jgi:hypothetical protein
MCCVLSAPPLLLTPQLHDIEELKTSCTRAKMCPYYLSRELGRTADLVSRRTNTSSQSSNDYMSLWLNPLPVTVPVPDLWCTLQVFCPYAYLLDPCIRCATTGKHLGCCVHAEPATPASSAPTCL